MLCYSSRIQLDGGGRRVKHLLASLRFRRKSSRRVSIPRFSQIFSFKYYHHNSWVVVHLAYRLNLTILVITTVIQLRHAAV